MEAFFKILQMIPWYDDRFPELTEHPFPQKFITSHDAFTKRFAYETLPVLNTIYGLSVGIGHQHMKK